MDATLTVPAGFVPYLRSGLFGEFGATAEKLSGLALQFGSGAPDGVYMPQLQNFFTVCMLLGEVGWKDSPTETDVVINLGIAGPQIVKGLQEEHHVLQQQLQEIPLRTTKGIRDAAAARVAEFEEFVKSVEAQAARARRRRLNLCRSTRVPSRSPPEL